jgi:hypothetical protein
MAFSLMAALPMMPLPDPSPEKEPGRVLYGRPVAHRLHFDAESLKTPYQNIVAPNPDL